MLELGSLSKKLRFYFTYINQTNIDKVFVKGKKLVQFLIKSQNQKKEEFLKAHLKSLTL